MLSEAEIVSLFALLEVEGPFSKVSASFRVISKRRGIAASWAKQGLHDLETTINHAQKLGIKVLPVNFKITFDNCIDDLFIK